MKYFTPDLHTRSCSLDDKVADKAQAEWDLVLNKYEKRIEKIRGELPAGFKKLCGELHLQDANLVCLLRQGDTCMLVLRLEPPSKDIVLLTYALTRDPIIDTDVLPRDVRSSRAHFMYDEIAVVRRNGRKAFAHSILFSSGLQLELTCRDVEVVLAKQLFPVTEGVTTAAVPRSA